MATFDIIRDTFSRTVVDDWGRADNGADWTILGPGPAANFDVSGGRGTVAITTVDEAHRVGGSGTFENASGYLIIRTNQLATGSAIVADVLMRYVDDNNYVAARVEFDTSNTAVTRIYKVVGGAFSTLQSEAIATYAANQDWAFRYNVAAGTINSKLWGLPGIEPPVWDTTGSVSDITTPGSVILQARRVIGNTNVGLIISFDNVEVTSTTPTVQIVPQFLDDYEFKFGQDVNAIVLNNGAANVAVGEPLWDVQKVTGLDLPDVKVSDKEFDGIDGGVIEAANISMRTVRLEGILYAHQDDSIEAYLDMLKTNFAPVPRQVNGTFFDLNQKPFFIKAPGVPERFLLAKSVGLKYDWDMARRFNSTPFQIILQAQVPTLFSPELHKVEVTLSGVITTEHRLQVYNAGNYHAYAVVQLFGIGNSPEVYLVHEEQNVELTLFLGISASLANRPVEINMRQRTVIITDTPPVNERASVVDEGWWRLQPGMNTIVVRTDEGSGGRAVLLWRDEWF